MDAANLKLSDESAEGFDAAFELLTTLVDLEEVNELYPSGASSIYTACVVLWMLVHQRLTQDASLESVVKHMIEHQPLYLPESKRVREKNVSPATGGYSPRPLSTST